MSDPDCCREHGDGGTFRWACPECRGEAKAADALSLADALAEATDRLLHETWAAIGDASKVRGGLPPSLRARHDEAEVALRAYRESRR